MKRPRRGYRHLKAAAGFGGADVLWIKVDGLEETDRRHLRNAADRIARMADG